jgi:hypothetical protein
MFREAYKQWERVTMGQDSIFDLELREKRAQAFLNKSRTGAKGGSKSRKGMRTPSDYLSRKEKRELNGEVESFNMKSLMSWIDFDQKDKDTQKLLLTQWREIYPNNDIMDAFFDNGNGKKFNTQSFSDLVNGLGCPPKRRGGSVPRKKREAKANTVAVIQEPLGERMSLLELTEKMTKPEAQPEPVQQIILKGMHFEYNGLYETDQINKILTKLQLLLEDEPNKFNISISISEKTK